MKTLYDKLPSGLETEDRAKVNRKMNKKKFSGDELRVMYYRYYINIPWYKRLFYPFVLWIWDEGVKKYKGEKSVLDNIYG
jgi:hypothetical protein